MKLRLLVRSSDRKAAFVYSAHLSANLSHSVLLQAMKQDPAADARCRDKFLVQSVNISGDLEFSNIQQIWDAVGKAGVQEKKIRVSWLPASDGGSASTPLRNSTHLTNGVGEPGRCHPSDSCAVCSHSYYQVESTPDVPPPAYSSPSEERSVTDAPAPNIKRERDDDHADFASVGQAASSSRSAPSTAIESVKAAAAGTKEELQAQLAKAQEKIAQLTQEVQSGLRQRKIPGVPDEKAGAPVGEQLATVMRQGSEGVPIKIVAMLCLVSFLLAYFFF
jgi:hypothetical protein